MGSVRQRGFTLVELMVAVLVMAIVVAFAVPGFESVVNGSRLTGAANEMLASLQSARMEAIRRNRRTVLCLSRNANSANPTCAPDNAADASGWITFVDLNRNGTYDDGAAALLRTTTAHEAVRILASNGVPGQVRVVYRADGFARSSSGVTLLAGAIDMCLPTRRPTENVRRITIGSGSRVSIERRDASGACAAPPDPT
jgi:type IV fimbrial biogenesis protein FimT